MTLEIPFRGQLSSASRTRAGKPDRLIDEDSAGCNTGMGRRRGYYILPRLWRGGSVSHKAPTARDRNKIRPSDPGLSQTPVMGNPEQRENLNKSNAFTRYTGLVPKSSVR